MDKWFQEKIKEKSLETLMNSNDCFPIAMRIGYNWIR